MRKLWIAAMLVIGCACAVPAAASAVQFPDGVASGDVTSTRAILWTRVDVADNIKLEVFNNAALKPPKVFKGKLKTSAARDLTVKIDAAGLKPNTRYWYRFKKDEDASPVGTFKTAPAANVPSNVKLGYTGDSDVTKVGGVPAGQRFQDAPGTAGREHRRLDLPRGHDLLGLELPAGRPGNHAGRLPGDLPRGTDLPEPHEPARLDLDVPDVDDHEVVNDYAAATVDPARYAAGRKAFFENMPIRETGLLHDASCAGDPIYRKYSWGSDVDIFMLDERSCRSAESVTACFGDLAPTLPTAARSTFPFSLFLSPTPPAGCLASLNNPSRTMLGPVQKAQFKNDLANSTAQYKFVVSQDPIQQFFVQPYDRWEGYAAERSEILNFIRNNGIDNTLFLTTDTHATLQNRVFMDAFTDPGTISNEMVTGPIATTTFQNEVIGVAGPVGLFAVNAALNAFTGMQCRNLNLNSYATVDTTSGGTTTITSKDDTGSTVVGVNTTGGSLPCTGTYGP